MLKYGLAAGPPPKNTSWEAFHIGRCAVTAVLAAPGATRRSHAALSAAAASRVRGQITHNWTQLQFCTDELFCTDEPNAGSTRLAGSDICGSGTSCCHSHTDAGLMWGGSFSARRRRQPAFN
jgi:hypothetical protein